MAVALCKPQDPVIINLSLVPTLSFPILRLDVVTRDMQIVGVRVEKKIGQERT